MKKHLGLVSIPHYLAKQLEQNCVQLIRRKHFEAALFIFCSLVEVEIEGKYGLFLLKEMLKCSVVTNR